MDPRQTRMPPSYNLITVVCCRHQTGIKLSMPKFEKLFSADEANHLIPRLEILMRELQRQASSLRRRIEELSVDDPSILHSEFSEIVTRYPELQSFTIGMTDAAGQIESLGCILKDIDLGLVDFPSES